MDRPARSPAVDPGSRDTTETVLAALREGVEARAVALFDDHRGGLHGSDHPDYLSFWDAFGGLPCVDVNWRAWYLELRQSGRVDSSCTCGAGHRLHGFLIHDRWVLLVVAPNLASGTAAIVSSAMRVLADKLPKARARADHPAGFGPGEGGEPGPAQSGIPMWWVRKVRE